MVAVVGTVVARYGYDPYGQPVEKSGPAADVNPWRYTGGYWDAGVGLYKLGARYYDPARGRFTQVDPLGGGYVYASDNPVNFVDPSGLSADFAGGLFDGSGLPSGTFTVNTIGLGDGMQTFTVRLLGISGDYNLNLNFTYSPIPTYYPARIETVWGQINGRGANDLIQLGGYALLEGAALRSGPTTPLYIAAVVLGSAVFEVPVAVDFFTEGHSGAGLRVVITGPAP